MRGHMITLIGGNLLGLKGALLHSLPINRGHSPACRQISMSLFHCATLVVPMGVATQWVIRGPSQLLKKILLATSWSLICVHLSQFSGK